MAKLIRTAMLVITTAAALYLVTEVVPGISIYSPNNDGMGFVWVALVFVAVNTVVGPLLRLLGMPLQSISYALSSLVINSALLWITNELSRALGLGLSIDGWLSLIAGAAILAIALWLVNTLRVFR